MGIWAQSNKGVEDRNKLDEEQEELETPGGQLEASWVAMSRKAQLYEKYKREGYDPEEEEEDDAERYDLGFTRKKSTNKEIYEI